MIGAVTTKARKTLPLSGSMRSSGPSEEKSYEFGMGIPVFRFAVSYTFSFVTVSIVDM